jgi:hypothetical protein
VSFGVLFHQENPKRKMIPSRKLILSGVTRPIFPLHTDRLLSPKLKSAQKKEADRQ